MISNFQKQQSLREFLSLVTVCLLVPVAVSYRSRHRFRAEISRKANDAAARHHQAPARNLQSELRPIHLVFLDCVVHRVHTNSSSNQPLGLRSSQQQHVAAIPQPHVPPGTPATLSIVGCSCDAVGLRPGDGPFLGCFGTGDAGLPRSFVSLLYAVARGGYWKIQIIENSYSTIIGRYR